MSEFRRFHLFRFLDLVDSEKEAPDRLLKNYFKMNKALGSKDRRFMSDIVYEILRDKGALSFLAESDKLRACAELLLNPDFSLDRKSLPAHLRSGLPLDLWSLLVRHHDESFAENFGAICNTPAPITIRCNPLKISSREKMGALWEGRYDFSFCNEAEMGIILAKRYPIESESEFKRGLFEFQDESSQCAVENVPFAKDDIVLDYCAGSGGKTLAFAHRVKRVFLYDVRRKCLKISGERLKKAGVNNATVLFGMKDLNTRCSVVVADVPCSGTGAYRRTPWLKWNFSMEQLKEFVALQRKIVEDSVRFLNPGGRLVYMTCSILPEENEEQVAFFQEVLGFKVIAPFYKKIPEKDKGDGFFMAYLQK